MVSTTLQCYEYVLAGIQKENAGTLDEDDFRVLFNAAQGDYVRMRLPDAERVQKRIEDLRALIPSPLVLTNVGVNAPEQEIFSLPFTQTPPAGTSQGYLYLLNCGLKLYETVGGVETPIECTMPGGYILAHPLRRDSRNDDERNPFRKPTAIKAYYYLVGNTLRVWAGPGRWALEARIEYVRHPVDVQLLPTVVEPDFPPHALQEICDIAVSRRLETIQSRRYPTVSAEQNKTPR